MPTTVRVPWTAPSGETFTFEYEIEKHYDASSVDIVTGTIFSTSSFSYITEGPNASDDDDDDDADTSSSRATKKRKSEQKVGYLTGYQIRRGQPNFHRHGDVVSEELHDFTVSLYNSSGRICRAPKSNGLAKIGVSQGGMLLVEQMEIRNHLKGMDLGIHFLHELLSCKTICEGVGLVVMKPWTLSKTGLRYKDNVDQMEESFRDKNESEQVDISRHDTVQLRRQLSRMGFKVIENSPDYADKWFLSMEKYKKNRKDDVKSGWLSKEQASQLAIPMKEKLHVDSEQDTELKTLLQSLFSQTNSIAPTNIAAMMLGLPGFHQSMPPSGSKLTDARKAQMKNLVEAGASLQGINALHMAAANYKSSDLFDHLIGEYGMSVETFDQNGHFPIHVAAVCGNAEAIQVLLARGANKKAKSKDGLTAKQELEKHEKSMRNLQNVMGFGMGMGFGGSSSQQASALLR
uniref:Uncharacterized protein n=1 Tax=Attheya septentrionalis TaxID=420275 RepID=A0A7S2U524_9STRA|mmetsp:Transcript_10739/g.19595  ORF Transcript_10739/g.19595 Transcript_10739/m.19595 type:complete len:460 (-) Transcript_10739:206-1585(-)